ncbi:MAG: amidohydrolase, partial [Gammaproteobacteria bacterium]
DYGNGFLTVRGIKKSIDGALGPRGAWLLEPYADKPGDTGHNTTSVEEIREASKLAIQHGYQMCVHAIGDRANRETLNIFEEAFKANPDKKDLRWRVEHAQHLSLPDIPRSGRLGVIASMQPYHAIDDGRWAEKRIGKERAKTTYAFRSLLDAGATLAFGTDWTVAPLDPMLTIYAAVTRRTLDGKNATGWVPEQKISVEETVRAYTFGSAYAESQENEKGTITPGKLADLVILSRDIFKIDPKEIENVKVVMTIMDGRIVYEAGLR